MKVKIFHNSDVLALERDINHWLDDQPAIDIRHTQTAAYKEDSRRRIVVTVWYLPKVGT